MRTRRFGLYGKAAYMVAPSAKPHYYFLNGSWWRVYLGGRDRQFDVPWWRHPKGSGWR